MTETSPPRIQKFLAGWGIASRRKIEEWIRKGRVLVDSQKAVLGSRLFPDQEVVVLDADRTPLYRGTLRGVYDLRRGRWLESGHQYWAVNKPRGVLTSSRDPHHTRMVTHLVPSPRRLFPVGRLDKDSEGLLLLTTDGELCHKLTHPRYGVEKCYLVEVDRQPTQQAVQAIAAGGVELADGPILPIRVEMLSRSRLHLCLREGRKREIRRLFRRFGYGVLRLVRTAFGPVKLEGLEPGKARKLQENEIDALREAVSAQRSSNRETRNEKRRPPSAKPGKRMGRRSSKSSARKVKRKGSRR